MVTGPLRGRLSIAVRPIRPAQLTSWPWPVFTEITCALTLARYSTPRRRANRFPRALIFRVTGTSGRFTGRRTWLSWDRATRAGGVDDELVWIWGPGVRARRNASLGRGPGSCGRGAEIGV